MNFEYIYMSDIINEEIFLRKWWK